MKPTIVWLTAVAGAALVIAGGAARRSGPAPKSAPRPTAAAPREEEPAPVLPAAEVSAASRDESVETLLEAKTGPWGPERRRAVIEGTVRHLGWTDAQRLALASAADIAAQEVEAAWSVREAQISDDPDEAVHDRYVECKRLALARIELLLDPSREPERRLQEGLEEWFDAIR